MGTPAICFECFGATVPMLEAPKCRTCDHPIVEGADCRNPVCNFADRPFEWHFAAAKRAGYLRSAIGWYKFNDKKGWAHIFARVLVGFLDANERTFGDFNLVVASPSFVADDGSTRSWDHTRLVISAAAELAGDRWPFDTDEPAAIVKTRATPPLSGKKSWRERHAVAITEIRDSLSVPDPARTRGKSILVYDDIFTDGLTLWEVARCLKGEGGAVEVCGVTLARQIYRGSR